MAKTRAKKISKSKNHKTQKASNAVNDLEVKTEADLPKLAALMKSKPVIVLVYIGAEEWCGPCQQYRPLWEKYKATPDRKVKNMVHVDHKMLPKTPFAKAKINGFPSNVIHSPHDNSYATFKSENGEETHAIPNIRDEAAMTTLLRTDPSHLVQNNNSESESLITTPDTRKKLTKSGKEAVAKKNTPEVETPEPTPPNTANDNTLSVPVGSPRPKVVPALGGSLFQSLVRMARGLGHPSRKGRRQRRSTHKAV